MTTFDRYIFSEWVKTFLLTMGLTLGLLLMEDMYDDLPDLLTYGANIMDVAWYYLVLLPSFSTLLTETSQAAERQSNKLWRAITPRSKPH